MNNIEYVGHIEINKIRKERIIKILSNSLNHSKMNEQKKIYSTYTTNNILLTHFNDKENEILNNEILKIETVTNSNLVIDYLLENNNGKFNNVLVLSTNTDYFKCNVNLLIIKVVTHLVKICYSSITNHKKSKLNVEINEIYRYNDTNYKISHIYSNGKYYNKLLDISSIEHLILNTDKNNCSIKNKIINDRIHISIYIMTTINGRSCYFSINETFIDEIRNRIVN